MVIRKKQGAPSLFRKLEDVFSVVETVNRAKGYHVLRAQKS
jgi:16S rRNA (guanine1207-N2)-methyltransferase